MLAFIHIALGDKSFAAFTFPWIRVLYRRTNHWIRRVKNSSRAAFASFNKVRGGPASKRTRGAATKSLKVAPS